MENSIFYAKIAVSEKKFCSKTQFSVLGKPWLQWLLGLRSISAGIEAPDDYRIAKVQSRSQL